MLVDLSSSAPSAMLLLSLSSTSFPRTGQNPHKKLSMESINTRESSTLQPLHSRVQFTTSKRMFHLSLRALTNSRHIQCGFNWSSISKMADQPVPVAQKSLLDVKMKELPSWIFSRDFTPNGLLNSVRRGHDKYYNKYINVKKGGIGGVAMLLAGYVILSYVWEYDHLSKCLFLVDQLKVCWFKRLQSFFA
ncbi:hypothetical protein JZ751_015239 [Albula glossodonta]|uniref:ATP synthase subunit f, mitochondrial n=1 Tax=Albula glossodonta TaxID=121402 RepID=A0A8T2NV85_9TELE|nr:hypothetical protein JZ751_015239 [Albula glossodonta]